MASRTKVLKRVPEMVPSSLPSCYQNKFGAQRETASSLGEILCSSVRIPATNLVMTTRLMTKQKSRGYPASLSNLNAPSQSDVSSAALQHESQLIRPVLVSKLGPETGPPTLVAGLLSMN